MTRFFGEVGFASSLETSPGVYEDVITEKPYYGDVIRNTRQLVETDKVNFDLTVNNSISIVADDFAKSNIFAIRYVRWMGALWVVSDVDVQSPRLILRLGGVYNGPTPGLADSS